MLARMSALVLALCAVLTAAPQKTRWPKLELVRELVGAHELAGDYDALRERLRSCPDRVGGQHVLEAFRKVMADPLAAPTFAIGLTDRLEHAARSKPGDAAAILRELALLLDQTAPEAGSDEVATRVKVAASWRQRLDLAAELMEEAAAELEPAFAHVDEDEQRRLRRAILRLMKDFIGSVYALEKGAHAQTWRAIDKVDLAPILRAAIHLAPLLDPAFYQPLRREMKRERPLAEAVPGVTGRVLWMRETALGPIVVGDTGTNRYELPVALLVDLGGNDTYAAETTRSDVGRPVNIVVDLRGRDTYEADGGAHFTQGCGLFGVSFLVDAAGNDTYRAGSIAQGVGVLGVGILFDAKGKDTYEGDAYVQGAGCFGVGVLLERSGDDRMDAKIYSQGFGGPVSAGLLLDVAGKDERIATGKYPSSYGTDGEFHSMSQGAGVGMRTRTQGTPRVAGGFGILVDGAGDDTSTVGEFGYGMGYFLGTGIVRDMRGDDVVTASRYGIATGAHQAAGLVLDDEGDDTYDNPHTASIAGNWDHMVSILVDAAGKDTYKGAGITCGASTITSFAALVDGDGRDTYETRSAMSFGSAGHQYDVRNKSKSFAIFVDLGRDKDSYPKVKLQPGPGNKAAAVRRRRDEHEGKTAESGTGLFVDR